MYQKQVPFDAGDYYFSITCSRNSTKLINKGNSLPSDVYNVPLRSSILLIWDKGFVIFILTKQYQVYLIYLHFNWTANYNCRSF